MVKKRKKRTKDTHKKNGLAKIANLTSKSFGSVLSNYKKNKELEKSIKSSHQKEIGDLIQSLESEVIEINDFKVILKEFEGIDLSSARVEIDNLKNKIGNLICVLLSRDGNKSSLIVSSSKSISKDVFSSNDLLQSLASLIGGKGGGKPDHAQAGGSEVKNFEKVFSEAKEYIQNI